MSRLTQTAIGPKTVGFENIVQQALQHYYNLNEGCHMFKSPDMLSRVLFLFIVPVIIFATGCADNKRTFLRAESYLGEKTISKIQLSANQSKYDKEYLMIEAEKILQQKELEADVYQNWHRRVKQGNLGSCIFVLPMLPIYLLFFDADEVLEDCFGSVGPWQKSDKDKVNIRETGRIETSVSNKFTGSVHLRVGNNSLRYLPLKEGIAMLYLPEFIEISYKTRPKSDVSIGLSVSEYDRETGNVEAETSYRVTKQHISELDIVSQKWLKADEDNELENLEEIAMKGNEKACYLVGDNRYKSWCSNSNPRIRDEALKYLIKIKTVDKKFMNRIYLNEMIGHLYFGKMDYDTAITYLKREQTYYSNRMLGLSYKNKNNYETAKQYFEKSMTLTEDSKELEFLKNEITDLNVSIIANNDKDLTPEIRKDKYLKMLGQFIEEKKYEDTFLYFSLLDNLKKNETVSLPKSLAYFKGFVYYNLEDKKNASIHLNAYLNVSSKEDKYYGNALDMILEIESSEL
ncbi:MAG: hypothetical protein JEZ07_14505 [Phycisphaerae bacterium]|nr:hypothetical protein [Phycisphaerae bacterium]